MNMTVEHIAQINQMAQIRDGIHERDAQMKVLKNEISELEKMCSSLKSGHYGDLGCISDQIRLAVHGLTIGRPEHSVAEIQVLSRKMLALAQATAMHIEYVEADRTGLAWAQLKAEASRPAGEPLPARFGLQGINQYTGKPNIIGGFAGLGKTTVLINILYEYMLQDKPVIFFSHEWMPGRVLASCINMFMAQFEGGSVDIAEILAMRNDEHHPRRGVLDRFEERMGGLKKVLIVEAKGWSSRDIIALYEVHRQKHGEEPHALIDYFQKISPDDDIEREDPRMRFKTTMNRITDFADSTNAVWTLAAQENRSGHKENRITKDRKTLYGAGDHSNFQETSAIEQDAALCVSIGREQDENDEWEPELVLRVNKNRFGKLRKSVCEIDVKSGLILRAI